MNELLPSNIPEFLARFQDFYDGIVDRVEFSFKERQVTVVCKVIDKQKQGEENWAHITLQVNQVSDFILIEERSTNVVLSMGVQVGFFEGKIYLDFSPYTELPRSVEDFRKSHFLVVGCEGFWYAQPIIK